MATQVQKKLPKRTGAENHKKRRAASYARGEKNKDVRRSVQRARSERNKDIVQEFLRTGKHINQIGDIPNARPSKQVRWVRREQTGKHKRD